MTDEVAIAKLLQDWSAATAAGDYAALEPLMHPDVLFLTSGAEPFGRDQFRLSFESITKVMSLKSSVETRELTVTGEFAFAHNYITVTLSQKSGGTPMERSGHVLSVYKRTDGRWQLYRDANLMTR